MDKKEITSRFTIDIPVEKHRRLKILAAQQYKSMRDMVMQSIERILEELEELKIKKN